MTPLAEILRETIRAGGPMPFPSYMGMALYHSEHGYYARGPQRIGRAGDFYTSASVGAVFGELMGGQFCAVWEAMGKPASFSIVERGANDGAFARDALTWAASARPDFFAAVTYLIDEPLATVKAAQERTLESFGDRVRWGLAGPARGVFFANELLDAIPFRRVRFTSGGWKELSVAVEGDGFVWVETELLDGATKSRLEEIVKIHPDFPEGYETEIAPAVASEVRLAASAISEGVMFFVDYGHPASDYYHPARRTGTLRCYRGHTAHENPFEAPGETDITAHVEFSLAAAAAISSGCELLGFCDQGHFLTGAAAETLRRMDGKPASLAKAKWLRQFQTLTHPAHMGRSFHVLAASKGNVGGAVLSGFHYARAAPGGATEVLGL